MKHLLVAVIALAAAGSVGCRRDDTKEIARLVSVIDVNPDPLHGDYTPAVFALIEHGRPAVAAILPLLNDPDVFRRLRAKAVLDGVTAKEYGFRLGYGFPNRESEEKRRSLYRAMGDYSADAPEAARLRSIALWREWLEKRPNQTPEPTAMLVTPPADAGVAPSTAVAHL